MSDGALHREDIKAKLRKEYGTVRAFEEAEGLPRGSVKDVLRGRSVQRTAEAIAEALDYSVQELFPGRYRLSPKVDNTRAAAESHRLNTGAR